MTTFYSNQTKRNNTRNTPPVTTKPVTPQKPPPPLTVTRYETTVNRLVITVSPPRGTVLQPSYTPARQLSKSC